jgi:NADH-quinone oxidoreductase subunit M
LTGNEELFTGLLTLAVFLPIGAAVLIALLGRGARNVRIFAAAVSVVEFLLTFFIFLAYDTSDGASQFQLVDRVADWIPIPSFEVQYFLAVDGLSAPLVMLAGLLGMVAIFASWSIEHRVREYFVWLLALQGAVVGVFTSLDFLLFFVFWELELIPMFFLISIWGSGRREYSAMKFLIFTILGSAFMLVGILILYFTTGSFDMTEMPALVRQAGSGIPALLVFLLLFVAFAVKLPVWPLHTWLPDAHTDAPTAASVMLAGVLLKMGAYGMFRLGSILPDVLRDERYAGRCAVEDGRIRNVQARQHPA